MIVTVWSSSVPLCLASKSGIFGKMLTLHFEHFPVLPQAVPGLCGLVDAFGCLVACCSILPTTLLLAGMFFS